MTTKELSGRPDAAYWIEKLSLTRHVEGGSFCEVYRSPGLLPAGALPDSFKGDRAFSTSIYFLLEKEQFSAFHRIASDEVWHFYFGDPLCVYEIEEKGTLKVHRLGPHAGQGEVFQAVVRAGNWFASAPAEGSDYSLTGCTVAPGFDFADFALADRQTLTEQYPQHAVLIEAFTR
ncbi:MAG: cupin domain-containing protein [Puia sp.]|nr:cupin domain-containing protein [Puia sp.]